MLSGQGQRMWLAKHLAPLRQGRTFNGPDVQGGRKLIAAVGLKDLIIVDTDDVVIC